MMEDGKISWGGAKDILAEMIQTNGDPEKIAATRGLLQGDSADIDAILQNVLLHNTDVVAHYKAGKMQALEFLVGQTMKTMKGAGNPDEIREKMKERLAN